MRRGALLFALGAKDDPTCPCATVMKMMLRVTGRLFGARHASARACRSAKSRDDRSCRVVIGRVRQESVGVVWARQDDVMPTVPSEAR